VVKTTTKTTITLNKTQQRDLTILTILFSLYVIGLWNLYWEPIVFMTYTTYIILNKNRGLTKTELLGFYGFAVPFLIYGMTARMYGTGPGVFILMLWFLCLGLLSFLFWRKKT